MIKRFPCSNFKNVVTHDLEFAKINLLVGTSESTSKLMEALSQTKDTIGEYSLADGYQHHNCADFISSEFSKLVGIRSLDATNFTVQWSIHTYCDIRRQLIFLERIKEVNPGVQVAANAIINNYVGFRIRINDCDYDLADLPEEMQRMLSLNMLINMPDDTKRVLFLENPEVGVCPEWQKITSSWIRRHGVFEQYFISTCSPEFLDEFTDVFREGDAAVFTFNNSGAVKRLCNNDVNNSVPNWRLGNLCR